MLQHLQQHPGGFHTHLFLVKAHGGQTRLHNAAHPAVANAGQTDLGADGAACRPECPHGPQRHRVGHAHHAVQIRAAGQQLVHAALALFHGKGRAAQPGQLVAVQPGSVQGVLHTLTARKPDGLILLGAADVRQPAVPAGQHPLGQLPGRTAIIVVHAGHLREALPGDHQRHPAGLEGPGQLRAVVAPQQDDARHMVALHGGQVAKLPLLVQLGVAQQNQIVLLIQFAGDAGGDLPHRLGADAGHNDPHLTHLAGAQGLRRSIRAVAGLFHYGLYHGTFLFAEGAAVQIAADRSAGNACHLCNITDGHGVILRSLSGGNV